MGFPAVATVDGSQITGLGPGKPLALLVYLAVRREARRDELVDLLWGEVPEANARNAFRQALHRLRTALGEDLVPPDRDRVGLVEGSGLWTDRDAFLGALDRDDLADAVGLYRGDFLEGFQLGEPVFDSWIEAERIRLKNRFQLALQTGAESALSAGRWVEALQYVQRFGGLAPYDEAAALLEASVLIAAGRSREALQSLRRFSQSLRDQLDLPPSARVREMLTRLERSDPPPESSGPQSTRAKPTTRFAGREEELGRLMGFVRGLGAEQGGTALIEGPAGIGKTRLVTELLGRAAPLGPLLVLRGRERPLATSLPYASVAEALRAALQAPGIAGTGRHLLAEAARILPELRDSFQLPDPAPIDVEGGRLRFFEGIAAVLDSVAYEQPVCVVLDDMHNSSASSLELIGYLAARLQSSPVLLLLLYRDGQDNSENLSRLRTLGDTGQDEAEATASMTIRLGPLGLSDVAALIDGVIEAKGAQGQVDVARLAAAADGNPLRAIDIARRALNGELPSATPVRLRDILWARLQQSSASQRRVFFAAALLQRRCSLRLLASAAHLPEVATLDAAQELETAGLLAHEGDGYVIAHDFTTAFVSEASGLAGRALLAGWAADALAGESGAINAELAQLYAVAGQQGPAFSHARRAAYDAAALGSNLEVHRLLGLALALAPDAKSRDQVEATLAAFGSGKRLPSTAGFDRGQESPAPPFEPVGRPAANEPPESIGRQGSSAATASSSRAFTFRFYALIVIGVITVTGAVAWRRSLGAREGPRFLQDSLVVIERGRELASTEYVVTGNLADLPRARLGVVARSTRPSWVQSLSLPWIHPSVSPDGRLVAVERMTNTGSDVFMMTDDVATAVPIVGGGGIDVVLGWAPDGRSLLVRRAKSLPDGGFDADLWAYRFVPGSAVLATPIDTSSSRLVQEAAWSPDGTQIGWVAQVGPTHQRDVFTSRADGADVENVSNSPGEDYHITWSSDGNLLAFTSDRDGNPDLFAIEFEQRARHLWRLTNTPYDEDLASFSPDHRFVAFQSTRGGDAAVYIMPALGGTPVRVTPAGGQFSIGGWRGRAVPAYVDRFRILAPSTLTRGDSVAVSLLAVDQEGVSHLPDSVPIRLLEDGIAALHVSIDSVRAHHYSLKGVENGSVHVVASIPGWRYDTLLVRVGAAQQALSEDFSAGIQSSRWIPLGLPSPMVRPDKAGRTSLFPNGDLQWQSGVLSREVLSLRDGLDLAAVFTAPFAGPPQPAVLLELAVVADMRDDTLHKITPQLEEYAVVAWDGESSRFRYSVGAESKSDPLSTLDGGSSHVVRIAIDANGGVTFFVDGKLRWTSSLRFLGDLSEPRGRVWIGGRATGLSSSVRDLHIVQTAR